MALTALLIPHPFYQRFDSVTLLLQSRQGTKEDSNRVSSTDRVSSVLQVSCEKIMGRACCVRRDGEDMHGFMVQPCNGLVDGVRGGRRDRAGELDARSCSRLRVGIIVRVGEPSPPMWSLSKLDGGNVVID